jgi:N-acetylglucosaminyl-diphospho-decaprenol L-rhamnosyltransferase
MIDLSIVIVNWNTAELLAACLRSVYAHADGLAIEVLVVDNASTDDSVAMVRCDYPQVRLIVNPANVGFARANNQAIAESGGRYVMLLNSDTELMPGCLGHLTSVADSDPRIAAVGARLANPDGSFQAGPSDFLNPATAILEPWGIIQTLTRNRYYPSYSPQRSNQLSECDWVGGACLVIRREAISDVGLLDETFFMNCEEMDWCYRMRRRQWRVLYDPDAHVIHHGGASADRQSLEQRRRTYASKSRYITKYYGIIIGKIVALNFRLSSLVKWALYRVGCSVRDNVEWHRRSQVCIDIALRGW